MAQIKKLTPYQHVRLRVPMYYSSVVKETIKVLSFDEDKINLVDEDYVPAVFTCFREILDNSLDELISHGYGDSVKIGYNEKTSIFYVEDNGRGIPIDWNEEHNMHTATLALSELMAGRNFEERTDSIGLNGIGASGVNYCSEYFNVRIRRDGEEFEQEFGENLKDDSLKIGSASIIPYSGKDTGTRIDFKLSKKVFKDVTMSENFVKNRIYEIAACNPLIKFYFNDELMKTKATADKTLFKSEKPIIIPIINKAEKFKSMFYMMPYFSEDSTEHDESLVNNIPTFKGGTHVDSFKRLFYNGLLTFLSKESKKRKLTPNRADIAGGMLLFNITNMLRPDFDSQSKSRLINSEATDNIKQYFDDETIFKNIVKTYPKFIEKIYERCAARTQKKDASEVAKLAKKVSKIKVAKLYDASGKDRSKCICIFGEGDSSVGKIVEARTPEIHGILPLRGKVLNVNGVPLKKVLENKVLQDIMNALGLVIGTKAEVKNLRYGQIWIATDSDPDGSAISSLLVNFFYTFWPELFENMKTPFINIYKTPFIIASKGKETKYWYDFNYDEFDPSQHKGWAITRAKGLGSLNEDHWKYSFSNPILDSIIDDGELKEALDLIFNEDRADDRKEWIQDEGNNS